MAADVGGWSLTLPCSGLAILQIMLSSLLLPTLAAGGVDVNVAALFMLSYKAVSTAESCAGVGNWRNGTCWEIEPMQAVVVSALLGVTDFN